MGIKIPVTDRVPTYPGRVTLTPVDGQANTYDMVRADAPREEGTPINKNLLDNKAYTLTESVTVYVNGATGNDETGDGSSGAPFATIQRAVNEIPKCLGGFHAAIDIAEGAYEERVTIDGFYGGRFTLGVAGRSVIVRGISVLTSSIVRVNISSITVNTNDDSTLFYIGAGSTVLILSPITLDGVGHSKNGISVEQNSILAAIGSVVTVNNCVTNGVVALSGGKITFGSIAGTGNGTGIRADAGTSISYVSRTITGATGQVAVGGGRIYSGAQTNIPG